jgi:hypothetical protein
MMDRASAFRFQGDTLSAIKELSSALLVAQKACNKEEFIAVRRSVGDALARIDNFVRQAVYEDHPDMDHLKDR